ncbi:hypothetical protein B5808_13450 [Cnuibacter physcomitrellae]|uniref:O-antigen ligase-related domain-containing protein n=1 Tax=Cnuibacter physcomitrellae TaxID=1619308 RepID=A0A1X9LLM9_9MICO|nr:O-antigen ligase family protein [Cnuibacter physcomitrellae]ARJ06116.1 hypothetical protein B5808_13450 [Cnuibacter physcomitrellae]
MSLLALLWLALVSAPTLWSLGPISGSGILTIFTFVLLLVALPFTVALKAMSDNARTASDSWSDRNGNLQPLMKSRFGHPWLPLAFGLFVVAACARLALDFSVEGLQNVAVYSSFAIAAVVVASSSSLGSADLFLRLARVLASAVGVIALVTFLLDLHLYDARAFALEGLVLLSIVIPERSNNVLVRLAPYVLTAAIALSLSRTATVIAIGMLVFVVLRGKRRGKLIRAILLLLVAATSTVLLVTLYPPFRDRFLVGDNAVTYGGVAINTSGRTAIWDLLLRGVPDAPVFGHGPGAASATIIARYPQIGHPHNDYIRILFDFGWIGLALFVIGYCTIIFWTLRRAIAFRAPIHWSATIALLGVGLSGLTDNAFVYPFVMVPLGVLVGLSLAWPGTPSLSEAEVSQSESQSHTAQLSGR